MKANKSNWHSNIELIFRESNSTVKIEKDVSFKKSFEGLDVMAVETPLSVYKGHAVPTSTELDLRNLNKAISLSSVSASLFKMWPYN